MSTEADKDPTKNQPEEITHPESLSVWGLAWPSILSNLLFASVGLVAIKAVGSLGAEAVAAVVGAAAAKVAAAVDVAGIPRVVEVEDHGVQGQIAPDPDQDRDPLMGKNA